MTREDLINTLRQGCRVTPKLVREIIEHLTMAGYLEANLKYYQGETQRLEDVLRTSWPRRRGSMNCEVCGSFFQPNQNHKQRICGAPNCRKELRRRTRAKLEGRKAKPRPSEVTCDVCGVVFAPLQCNQTTCSNFHCKRTAKKRRAVARYNDEARKEKTETCPICGRRYAPKRDIQKTCGSAACVATLGKRSRQVSRNCVYCGTEFKTDPNSSKKYCSKLCADAQREALAMAEAQIPDPWPSLDTLPAECCSWYQAEMMPVL